MTKLYLLLTASMLLVSPPFLASAAINNPGIPLDGVPEATQFLMPFGDRLEAMTTQPNMGMVNGFAAIRYNVGFRNLGLQNNNTCGRDKGIISNGWFVYTGFNTNRTYNGKAYGSLGSFHPGEDWNGLNSGTDEFCQPVYPIADGKVIAKGNDPEFGNMLFILHKVADGNLYISVYAHLYQIPAVSIGTVVSPAQEVGRVDTTGDGVNGSHLHWEIRKQSFLDIVGATVKLKQIGSFRPDAWPGTDSAFITQHYCEPSAFVRTSGGCGVPPTPRVQWLSFMEGEPGIPGDGIITEASATISNQWLFTLTTPIPFSSILEGFGFQVYLPTNLQVATVSVQYNFSNAPSCTILLGGAIENLPVSLGSAKFNGISGYAEFISPDDVQGWIDSNGLPGNCDADHTFISSIFIFVANLVSARTLDAAALLR